MMLMEAHVRVTQNRLPPFKAYQEVPSSFTLIPPIRRHSRRTRGTVVFLPSYRTGHQHRKEFCKNPSHGSKVISGETQLYTDGHDDTISLPFP